MSLDYNKKNVVLAKNLRKNGTKQEKRLWYDFLSGYQPRFTRQKPIGEYIADFYCDKVKLVIELDGSRHNPIADNERTKELEKQGVTVVRYTNYQIDKKFKSVCGGIDITVKNLLKARESQSES